MQAALGLRERGGIQHGTAQQQGHERRCCAAYCLSRVITNAEAAGSMHRSAILRRCCARPHGRRVAHRTLTHAPG